MRMLARVSVMVLQRFSSASSLWGSSFRNFTASTSTRSTTRILLCRLGNWSIVGTEQKTAVRGRVVYWEGAEFSVPVCILEQDALSSTRSLAK